MPRARWCAIPVVLLGVALVSGGCRYASADARPRWVRVARDAAYDIYMDTARIRPRVEGRRPQRFPAYDVWYRTDHQQPRLYKGKQFNREIVHSIVQCDSLWYKVISVDMSLGEAAPISKQRMTPDELAYEVWRRVDRGTSDEIAARAACHFGSRIRKR